LQSNIVEVVKVYITWFTGKRLVRRNGCTPDELFTVTQPPLIFKQCRVAQLKKEVL